MKFQDFQHIMSTARMSRYLLACGNNSKMAMTLYRLNLRLSQELFTVISCFEVSLRNAIDRQYLSIYGNDWLRNAARPNGIFDTHNCRYTKSIIDKAINALNQNYSHSKLIAEMDFGFWRYLFAQPQFHAGRQALLHIFPAKPKSSKAIQYNQSFVFNQLGQINELRNRIAHHEPICFEKGLPNKSTKYVRQHYILIVQLFQWMSIDEARLLYGLDHINSICNQMDALK